jgi:zinc transporter
MPDPSRSLSPYGADAHGLVYGYAFGPGRAGQLIDGDQALHFLHDAVAEPGFVWLHIHLSHAGAEPWLREALALPEDFLDALRDGSRSTRIERNGETLFAVVNDVTFDFAYEATDVATLWLSVGPRLVVSARRHPLRSVERLRAAVKRGEPMASSVALLDHLLNDQADELQQIGRVAGERADDIEDDVLAGHVARNAGELARLRRLMVRLQRLLAPDPTALIRTLAQPPAWIDVDDLARLRHAADEFAVVLRDLGALQERIKLLQEESAAQVAQENNRTLFLLTMVTVLALPMNLVAGLLGMNVGGVPLAQHAHGFWWVLGLVLLVTLALAALLLRKVAPQR